MYNSYKQNLKKQKLAIIISSLFALSGCTSLMEPHSDIETNKMELQKSYLESERKNYDQDNKLINTNSNGEAEFIRLNSLDEKERGLKLEIDLSSQFSEEDKFLVSVNELPLNDFLHYVLGELLNVSYLIEPSVKENISPVTLELKEEVTGKQLFLLVQNILSQHQVNVVLNEGVFFIHPISNKGGKDNVAFGYGRSVGDVPNVSGDIIQLVPLKYGTSNSLRQLITSLVNADVSSDSAQGLITVKGKRPQITRAMSLIGLIDSPAINDKSVALLKFKYIDSETFIEKVSEILELEGINSKRTNVKSASVNFVPIEHLGQVIVFAASDDIVNRVEYWTKQLDKPATGLEQSFYTYHPKYARAADLGDSLAPLISFRESVAGEEGGSNSQLSRSLASNVSRNSSNSIPQTSVTTGDKMRMVVDERSNSLIFYSSGKHYQELQPIIRKLDVMPKQVMLEVIIAEVTLTGSFAKGVEYAIKSGPGGSKTENFNYNGDAGFSYSVVGLDGNITLNLNQKDGLVNVLSRPTLLVRDGVDASISVGDDVPTVGSTTTDPISGDRETTNIQYRKTGIDLTVTPTVNAQGTVIMSITQNISNIAADGLTISGSPSIFERKVSTEVVAGDGQTVMLGGLISENVSNNANAIPGLGSLPLLGHLFRSDSETTSKTELVILVTPKIVQNLDDWERVQNSFMKGLQNINF